MTMTCKHDIYFQSVIGYLNIYMYVQYTCTGIEIVHACEKHVTQYDISRKNNKRDIPNTSTIHRFNRCKE